MEKRVCGIIANTLTDVLVHNMSYNYVDPVANTSVPKTVWDRMTSLFASHGLTGQLYMFHQAQCVTVRPQTASEDINCLTNLFNQIAAMGLTLLKSFKQCLSLNHFHRNFTISVLQWH